MKENNAYREITSFTNLKEKGKLILNEKLTRRSETVY